MSGIKMSGLVSGLDTDSIVKELISAQTTKKENLEKTQTKLSWKQDAWKALNTKVYSFYSDTLTNMKYVSSYNKKATTVSDTSVASITSGSSAVNGTQTLSVSKLAKSGYMTGGEVAVTAGGDAATTTKLSELGYAGSDTSFDITVDGATTAINLTADSTVSDVITKLKEAGVNASFDTTNQRFFVSSKTSGADADFSISASTADGTNAISALGLNTASATNAAVKIDGQDANIYLNGASFTSATNAFTINGLTITAQELTSTEGSVPGDADYKEVSVSTTTDVDGIYDMVKKFFTSYNSLVNEMDALYNADSASGYDPLTDDEKESMSDDEIEKWETKIKDALLRKDGTLNDVASTMKTAMLKSYDVDGSTYSLSSFGIATLGYFNSPDNQQNAFHIDGNSEDSYTSGNTDKLKTLLSTDPDKVTSFMTQLTSGLYTALDKQMKSTSLRSAYTVYNDKEMDDKYDEYTDEIDNWEDKIADLEDYYYAKFSTMETALSKLNSQQSSLSSLIG